MKRSPRTEHALYSLLPYAPSENSDYVGLIGYSVRCRNRGILSDKNILNAGPCAQRELRATRRGSKGSPLGMIRLRVLLPLGWIALSVWLLIPSPVLSQLGQAEVTKVMFQGNESFPDDSLARAIVTRETECRSVVFTPFCWAGANFALQRFYFDEVFG